MERGLAVLFWESRTAGGRDESVSLDGDSDEVVRDCICSGDPRRLKHLKNFGGIVSTGIVRLVLR